MLRLRYISYNTLYVTQYNLNWWLALAFLTWLMPMCYFFWGTCGENCPTLVSSDAGISRPVSEASFVIRDSLLSCRQKNANERRKTLEFQRFLPFEGLVLHLDLMVISFFVTFICVYQCPAHLTLFGIILFIIT